MKKPEDLVWSEKYRPKSLSEIIGQKQIVERLSSFVQKRKFTSMIFAGEPGIGKTTAAIAFANDLYGADFSAAFKELNASDDRGIDVVRGAIKEFAKTVALASVPMKIIFLDEADALTSDAQHALRRIMEKYASETVFILSANYASKIIEPIQSRCIVFRFRHLNEGEMREYIDRIAKGEDLEITDSAANALIDVSEGDLRKLTNLLQSASAHGRKVTDDRIYDVAARARPKEISAMLKHALDGSFDNARIQLDEVMLKHGMRAEDVLTQCYKEVQGMGVDEKIKLNVIKRIGECNFRIVEGANERIQLEAFLAELALLNGK